MSAQELYLRPANATEARGPFPPEQLADLARAGEVTPETLVYDPNREGWVALADRPELLALAFPPRPRLTLKPRSAPAPAAAPTPDAAPAEFPAPAVPPEAQGDVRSISIEADGIVIRVPGEISVSRLGEIVRVLRLA